MSLSISFYLYATAGLSCPQTIIAQILKKNFKFVLRFYFFQPQYLSHFPKKFVTNLLLTVYAYQLLSLTILYYNLSFDNTAVSISRIVKIYLAVLHIPDAIIIFCQTGIVKVHFPLSQVPPAIFILCYCGDVCGNLTILIVIPVAIGCFLIGQTVFDSI